MDKYIFKEYDPIYLQLFKNERKRLSQLIKTTSIIEHFGSTSVQGLGGKGIIDIYVVVPKENIQTAKEAFENAGYEYRPGAGTKDRLFFRLIITNIDGSEQRYHIHLTNKGNPEFTRDIAFRDYLRTHPQDMTKYSKIKQEASLRANNNKDVYMKIKEPIILEILEKIFK